MEIKPITENLKIFRTKIDERRRASKTAKSRLIGDKKIFEISDEAKQIQRIRKSIDEMPDVRPEVQDLIDELASEIEDGTYLNEVSGRDIVAQIIAKLGLRG